MCAALIAVTKLVNTETLPALLEPVALPLTSDPTPTPNPNPNQASSGDVRYVEGYEQGTPRERREQVEETLTLTLTLTLALTLTLSLTLTPTLSRWRRP